MAAIATNQRSGLRALFTFPHPVNEYAARSVAAMVFTLALVIIVADVRWAGTELHMISGEAGFCKA